jgi:hypothetical protein
MNIKEIEKEIEKKVEEMEDKYEIETLNSEERNWFDEFEIDIDFIRKKAQLLTLQEVDKFEKFFKKHKREIDEDGQDMTSEDVIEIVLEPIEEKIKDLKSQIEEEKTGVGK